MTYFRNLLNLSIILRLFFQTKLHLIFLRFGFKYFHEPFNTFFSDTNQTESLFGMSNTYNILCLIKYDPFIFENWDPDHQLSIHRGLDIHIQYTSNTVFFGLGFMSTLHIIRHLFELFFGILVFLIQLGDGFLFGFLLQMSFRYFIFRIVTTIYNMF